MAELEGCDKEPGRSSPIRVVRRAEILVPIAIGSEAYRDGGAEI
jgi:hypothetical protein